MLALHKLEWQSMRWRRARFRTFYYRPKSRWLEVSTTDHQLIRKRGALRLLTPGSQNAFVRSVTHVSFYPELANLF
jgi:hypothetical protein